MKHITSNINTNGPVFIATINKVFTLSWLLVTFNMLKNKDINIKQTVIINKTYPDIKAPMELLP